MLIRTSTLILAALACLAPFQGTAQTITPVSVQATMLATNDTSQSAVNNTGEFTAILYSTPTVPLPGVLPAGNYPAWCGTKRLQSFGNDLTYTATSTPPSVISPTELSNQTVWNEINYVLNHKSGFAISDVQAVIWGLTNGLCAPTATGCTSDNFIQSKVPTAYPLWQSAISAAAMSFVPQLGDNHMALLINPIPNTQHIVIELKTGGQIGDRVWQNGDGMGVQNSKTVTSPSNIDLTQSYGYYKDNTGSYAFQYTEPGINGVKVDLYSVDAFGNTTFVKSTVTSPSPASYPYLPPNSDGWYDFTGLVAGNYQVRMDVLQANLGGAGYSPTKIHAANATAATDSDDPILGGNTTLSDTAPIDTTLDFGFTGTAPLKVTCATSTGSVGVPYSSRVAVSGGLWPYTFSVSNGALPGGLSLDANTGTISGTPTTDGSFSFTVQVMDATHTPAFTMNASCGITIAKAMALACADGAAQVGAAYSSSLVAMSGVAPYTYSTLDPLPAGLTLNSTTGAISGTPTTAGLISYRAQAVDSTGTGAQTVGTRCSINVAPKNLTPNCVSNTAAVGASYMSRLTAIGGTGGYTFSIVGGDASLPPGLHVDTTTWTVTGTPTTAGTYGFTIQVTDNTGNTGSINCQIVVGSALTVTCASTSGFVGPYSSGMTVIGGSGMLGFNVVNGSLPPGLVLDPSNGTIAGTATTAGAYSFTVEVTDKITGAVTDSPCTIQIYSKPSLICNGGTTTLGAILNASLVANGGSGHYTYSLGSGSPSWMSINSTTGAMSGSVLNLVSPLTWTGAVTDSTGNQNVSVLVTCSATVNPKPALSCPTSGMTGTVGMPFTPPAPTPSGGTAPYKFSIGSGSLPAGLTLDPATGLVTGTPTAAGSYSLQVTDSKGVNTTGSCSYTIAAAPVLTCASSALTSITVGGTFSVPALAVSGGVAPYTFSVATGALPAGVTLTTSNGAVSGSPSTTGSFTLQVTDANGAVSAGSCAYSVTVALSMTCPVGVSAGIVGVPFTAPAPLVTGGTAGYTFSVVGTLPAGLTLNADGSVSGTPTASGSFSIQVKDAKGVVAGTSCAYAILPAITANCVAINAIAGVAITPVTMTATGGTSTGYTFSATGLPAGITMAANGTISGSTTQTGSFPYTVTVTDSAGHVGTFNCSVSVNAPAITATCVTINAIAGMAIAPVTMTAGGGSGTGYTFSATGLPNGLTMASNGTISGTPTVSGTFNYTVTITDSVGTKGTFNCSVTVYQPVSATCAAISAITGVPMTPVTLSAGGGTGSYTFSASGLPAGVTISAAGTISGTPTVSGSFVYTVTVTDSKGNKGTATCSITVGISSNLCGLTWGYWKNHVSVWPVTSMILGNQPYSQAELITILGTPVGGDASLDLAHQLIAAKFNVLHGTNPATDGGAIAAADNLLDNYSGKLPYNVTSGGQMTTVASQLDTFNSDGAGQPGCGSGPSAMTVVCAASTGSVGIAYNSAITASGGMGGPYTYTLASGTLPPGLTLNPVTGAITGTPTDDGIFNFSVLVADSSNNAGSTVGTKLTNCTITIYLAIQCPTVTAKVNEPYASPVVLNGATGSFVLSLTAGSLPPGLTLDTTTNAIKGTPTAAGTYTFTIKGTEVATGATVTSNCTITVVAPTLSLICPSATAQTTVNYSSPVVATGGSAPYTFSLISGTLPPGITGNPSTGQIYGTPTAVGTYTFGVMVTDSAKTTASTSCSIAVTTPTGNISAGMFTTYTQGGWGASPKGNNPGMFLSKNFASVYGSAGVTIGGAYSVKFGASNNIDAFLPQGGTAGVFKATATNPTSTAAGVFAGQILALQLSVDFSNKGLTPGGLSSLHVVSGKMAGYTVGQVLSIANQVLGGTISALPAGLSVSDLNSVIDSINNNFDNGTSNKGYLKY